VISRLLILVFRLVRLTLTPFAAMTSVTPRSCKFEPTCSHYAEQAVRELGPARGLLKAAWRLLRCNPWSKGGYDPVVRP
jgi:uncharacterized protein